MSSPGREVPSPTEAPGVAIAAHVPRDPVALLLWIGVPIVAALMLFTAIDVAGQRLTWESAHWTAAAILGFLVAAIGVRNASPEDRPIRRALAAGLGLYLLGQIVWDIQTPNLSPNPFHQEPSIPDALVLASAVPIFAAFALAVHQRLRGAEEHAVYLDAMAVVLAVTALILAAFSQLEGVSDPLTAVVWFGYPISFLATAGGAWITALALGTRPSFSGVYVTLAALALLGLAWVGWLVDANDGLPSAGAPTNYAFSLATIALGVGAATWRVESRTDTRWEGAANLLLIALPVVAVIVSVLLLASEADERTNGALVDAAAGGTVLLAMARQTLLLRQRSRFMDRQREAAERERVVADRERDAREEALAALEAQRESEARYRSMVDVFNRLGEQMTLTPDEPALLRAAAAALHRLVPSPRGDVLTVGPEQDELVVAAAWGDDAPAQGTVVLVDSPIRCLGVRRGSVYIVEDASDDLQVICPAHPTPRGSVMCAPMVALGQVVGVIHLERSEPSAFDVDAQRQATRVAEQVGLAVANGRLIRKMEALALTDPLTGMPNARFFDPYLDRELAAADRDGQPLGLVMVDIDHFKQFNDMFGHAAGDDALRTFASTARKVLRASDVAARYGGEEFVIALRHADLETSRSVAEKLRQAVEGLPVEVSPGRHAGMTISLGVASSVTHGTDRMSLLRAADRGLYAAKRGGRNRVEAAAPEADFESRPPAAPDRIVARDSPDR